MEMKKCYMNDQDTFTTAPRQNNLLKICIYGNALVIAALGLYYFLIPAAILVNYIADPALQTGEMTRFTTRWHKQLSANFEPWARGRVESGEAAGLSLYNISATEWPIFSSVYYLWATEALQEAWKADPTRSETMPSEYARGAIEAAAELIIDPNHAAWVKRHWGEDYLYQENIFYRMLYISGLTSYQKLTGDDKYQDLLLFQIDTLSEELDQSPYGLLDDYPGQCYPIDILPAIAAIQRADALLGTDHAAQISRASRAFEGSRLDPQTGLPAYIADSRSGEGSGPARGVGVSYMLIWMPELWPDKAQDWYGRYEDFYWQLSWLLAGYREFAQDSPYPDWYFLDVDAGPVIAGYGTAASAFGIGAARANGRMDQAYPLSAEALAASWPLPDGTLLGPRLLSNLSDAPYLGESALLFNFTRIPQTENVTHNIGKPPAVVYLGILFYGLLGSAVLWYAIQSHQKRRARILGGYHFPMISLQIFIWAGLLVSGVVIFEVYESVAGILMLLLMQLIPGYHKDSS